MRVVENAKKEFMKFTEKEREELKYNQQNAAVIRDILENGESFTREKWESIYKSKETPWRNDKLMQEVMVKTKGFPDELCEKILSCAFNKRIYKAALSRDDISLKNIEIALAGISERELTKSLQAKELSGLVVNQIAKRAINRMMYDAERVPDRYEMYALEQMTDKEAAKHYLDDIEFGEVGEKILTIFANNPKLEEIRDDAFNLGCIPEKITEKYTPYMEEIIVSGALYSYFDSSSSYHAKQESKDLLINVISKQQISEDMEKQIINEFVAESGRKYYGDNDILATLLTHTKSPDVMREGLMAFPSFASELIFKNPNTPASLVEKEMDKELLEMLKMSLNTKSKIKLFSEYKEGLYQKIDGPWKDVVFGEKVYDRVVKPDNSLITGKADVIAEIASAKSTPDKYLDKLLSYTLSTPDTQQVESVAIIKLNTLMNKKLREHDLPSHMMSGFSMSEFMRNVDNTVRYMSKTTADELRGATIRLASNVTFAKQKNEYMKAFKEVRDDFSKYQTHPCPAEKQVTEKVENVLDAVMNETEKVFEAIMAVNKAPEECNRKEIEIAKMLILNSSKDVAKDDPLAYILGYEDAMNEFVKLAQREHQLDIEEGKVAGGSTIEQILDDGVVMMGESTPTTPPTTRTTPVIEDIEL